MPGDVATGGLSPEAGYPSLREMRLAEMKFGTGERPIRTIMSPSLYIRFLFPLVNFAFSFKTWLILFIRNVRVIICDIYVHSST